MFQFDCTILRERFTITPSDNLLRDPIVALSNRVRVDLKDATGQIVESFIIRGQMLHTVVRFAATIMNNYDRMGPLLVRDEQIDWEQLWILSAGGFERDYNRDLWVVIYNRGKPIFQDGTRHPFLDVVEQCAIRAGRPYENAVMIAEELFEQAGKNVTIHHDSNIACTFQIGSDHGRVALVLRDAQKTRTFNFTGDKRDPGMRHLNPVNFINTAAAFLEGIQLCYVIGVGNERLRQDMFTPGSEEGLKIIAARSRLAELNATIRAFEDLYSVHYRPEKPEFPGLIINAEEVTARRLLEEQVQTLRAKEPMVE